MATAKKERIEVRFDPNDREGMLNLMATYGERDDLSGYGENEDGENVSIDFYPDHITVTTYQRNKWIRVNTYWDSSNDFAIEETFEGKWNDE